MNTDKFATPKDPALHALWVIRNWTFTPIGNLNTHEQIVKRVHELATEILINEAERK